jgi:C4-dicarboxylate transporter DctQ subunit
MDMTIPSAKGCDSGSRMQAGRPSPTVRLLRSAISLTERLIGLVVIAAVLLNFANIVGRHLLGRAIVGADEVLIYLMIGVVFIGVIVVTARDAHLRMSMMVDVAPQRFQRWMRRLEWLTLAVVAGFVSWIAASTALQLHGFGQLSLSSNVPMWAPHGVVALGFAATAGIALRMCRRGGADDARGGEP